MTTEANDAVNSVQLISSVQLLATPWTAACQPSLSFSMLKFMFIELAIPTKHLILCRPLLLLPSILPSTRVVSNESALCIRWPKYWSFSCSISPSSEYSGLISFKIGWFDLFVVQGTQESSLASQFESINSLVFSLLYDPTLTSVQLLEKP